MVFFLELVQRMVLAPAAEQAEIFANIKRDHDTAGTPAGRFARTRHADHHVQRLPDNAQKLLRQVVARTRR
ncbi:MAG: hypothetical protein R3E65_08405 [Steroidobacteraceae bacterium]